MREAKPAHDLHRHIRIGRASGVMVTAPEVIEKFLSKVHADPPMVKGRDRVDLDLMIYNCTGAFYEEKITSRPHQLEGVAFALYQRNALLLYHMRLGKSKMGLDWAAQLRKAGFARKKGLILAHAPIGAEVWQGQVRLHSNLKAIMVGSGPQSGDRLVDALESDADLIILSHTLADYLFAKMRINRKGENKRAPDLHALDIASAYFDHAIIDETHFYRNPERLPFKIASELTVRCKYVLGLTGTPVGRDPYAIWAQAYLVDRGRTFGRNYYFFREAFGRQVYSPFNKANRILVFDKTKMPLLQYKLDTLSLAYGKHEVRSAEVFANVVELAMIPEQKRAYNDTVDRLLKIRLDDPDGETETIFMKLRQIASGYLPFVDADGIERVLHFPNAVKMAWLEELVTEIPTDNQVVIFHEFVHSGELIAEMLEKHKISHVAIRGMTSRAQRARNLLDFQEGRAQFLVANIATGGTAIELGMADYLCFYESPVSPITRAQAQARPMGRPLDRPLFIDDLVCSPVELRILGFLAQGENLLSALMRGGKDLRSALRAR